MKNDPVQNKTLLVDFAPTLARTTGRSDSLFREDLDSNELRIREQVAGRRILVTGAAGSIGSATVKELARYRPALLSIIDLSENNLVEVVRDIRSNPDLCVGDALKTAVVDFGSDIGDEFIAHAGPFDLVLHFAAMKHVRSERDVFSLSRLVQTNVLKVDRLLGAIKRLTPCDVFAISSDKACAPANVMGASKRLMEEVVFWHANNPGSLLGDDDGAPLRRVACTRFANVAFSDGSLLAGFMFRIRKRQPLAGPNDVRRYFITEEEAGQLCLMTAALAKSKEIYVPRLDPDADVKTFDEIAEIVLDSCGFKPRWYDSDEEARTSLDRDVAEGYFPCAFSSSDTSGEKDLEEFVGPGEHVAESRFHTLDVIDESPMVDDGTLAEVLSELQCATRRPDPSAGKQQIIELVSRAVPTFQHVETSRDLDQKM